MKRAKDGVARRVRKERFGKVSAAEFSLAEACLVTGACDGHDHVVMKFSATSVLLLAVIFSSPAPAMFIEPEMVPVKRLLAMAEKATAKDPMNAEAHYTLARTHYLAFVSGAKKLEAYLPDKDRPLPGVESFQKFTGAHDWAIDAEAERRVLAEMKIKSTPWSPNSLFKRYLARRGEIKEELNASGWRYNNLPETEAAAHLSESVVHFQTAIKLAPKNSLYRLGYAALLEQASDWSKRHSNAKVPKWVVALTPKDIRKEYFKAWEMEFSADLKNREDRGMFSPMDMVSYEAGTALVRLAGTTKSALSTAEKKTVDGVKKGLVKLKYRTGTAITPIIFATHAVAGLAELLAPETEVDFPVRGWGPVDRWPWVQPDTAILVWNPSRSGRIESGAQLFGSYTWELFWKNGYEPLTVLDADGDGTLRGAELDGLAAWRDQNSDGISDPGEVEPLAELGITAFATHSTAEESHTPMNPRGVTFADGRTLPTWDWIVTPLSRHSPAHLLSQKTR